MMQSNSSSIQLGVRALTTASVCENQDSDNLTLSIRRPTRKCEASSNFSKSNEKDGSKSTGLDNAALYSGWQKPRDQIILFLHAILGRTSSRYVGLHGREGSQYATELFMIDCRIFSSCKETQFVGILGCVALIDYDIISNKIS